MTQAMRNRAVMTLIGALAGLGLYGLSELYGRDDAGDRLVVALSVFGLVAFTALLALTGPMPLRRAVPRAGLLGLIVSGLHWMTLLRFPTAGAALDVPQTYVALFLLATLPLPFLVAAAGPGWRDYPTLFTQAWSIIVRFAAAFVFVGLVWLVIFLSDTLLHIAGLRIIRQILDIEAVPFALTGAMIGLGIVVVTEVSDLLSPNLLLRLLRLVLPVVLVVTAVFLVALPFQGFHGLFWRFSAALTLLSLVGAGVALVAATLGPTDAEGTSSPMLLGAARLLCLLLPFVALLAAAAVILRIRQYGLSPERLFAALVALFALAYGAMHAAAALRGPGWADRVRRGNVVLALAAIAVSGLWLTPVLNAERLSAAHQLSRFAGGDIPATELDLNAIEGWGRPGMAAMAALKQLAATPGNEALAEHIARRDAPLPDPQAAQARLTAVLPLQPASATATRDLLLAGLSGADLSEWADACGRTMAGDRPGCVMVVADLLPRLPGEEAIILLNRGSWVQAEGLVLRDGTVERRQIWRVDAGFPAVEIDSRLIAEWQAAPPPSTPVQMNQLGMDRGLMLMP